MHVSYTAAIKTLCLQVMRVQMILRKNLLNCHYTN